MRNFILTICAMFFSFNTSANAADVMEIVKKAIHASYYQGETGRAKADMRIIDKQGRERIRSLTLLRKNLDDQNGPQKYYAYFHKPADINKMVFMAWKNIGSDDDRWLYLSALDLVKRIAASDERTSFVGSNFFYEDVSGRNIDEDIHEIVEENGEFYVIKSTPKEPASVEFSYYKNWVDKETFIPMKTEYFKDNGNIYRSYLVEKVEVIDGYPTVIDAQMSNNETGGKTLLNYSDIQYNIDLPESIFAERYLRKAPKKYLR